MAKKCDVCKKTYADDLESCPHCDEAFDAFVTEDAEPGGDQVGSVLDEPETPAKAGKHKAAATMLAPSGASPEDSGIDLDKEAGAERPDSEIDLAVGGAAGEPDSGLDLSAMADAETGKDEPAEIDEDEAASALLEDLHEAPTATGEDSVVSVKTTTDDTAAEPVPAAAPKAKKETSSRESFSEMDLDLDNLGQAPTTDQGEIQLEPTNVEMTEDEAVDFGPTAVADEAPAAARPAAVRERRSRGWLGGGVVGAFLGSAAACGGLWLGGLLNLDGDKPTKSAGGPAPGAGAPAPAPAPGGEAASPEQALHHVRTGEFEKALPMLGEGDAATPEQLATRGEARWLNYLQQQRGLKAALKAEDEAVKQAMDDLGKSSSVQALFWLGHIKELLGDIPGAQKTYQEGLAKSAAEPAQQRRFQAALDRLETRAPVPPLKGARLDLPVTITLAVLLTALQAEPQPPAKEEPTTPAEPPADAPKAAPPAAPPEPEEAGYTFWSAVRLAHNQNYAGAIKALQQAKALHEQRRFVRLRKAQNPDSDPNEEIFLRSCDELITAWRLASVLTSKDQRDPTVGLNALLMRHKQLTDTLEPLQTRLKEEKVLGENEDLAKGIEQLIALKGKLEKDIASLDTALKTAKKAGDDAMAATKVVEGKLEETGKRLTDAETQLKTVTSQLEAAGVKNPDPLKGVAQLVSIRNDLEGTLNEAAKKLEAAKFVAAKPDRKALLQAIENALTVAQTKDPQRQLQASQTEITRYRDLLEQRHTPQQMLAIWLPLLESRDRKDAAATALQDAQRVLEDPKATRPGQAEAHFVRGLALRNQGKYPEAKAALQLAIKTANKEGSWLPMAQKILQGLTDPAVYYVARADELRNRGQLDDASAVVQEGLGVFADNGRLLAMRSLLTLDQARSKARGRVPASNPAIDAASKDAQAAVAAGAVAEGSYAAGLAAEEVGNWAEAQKYYQKALESYPANDATGSRYRLALARVLLKLSRPGQRAPEAPKGDRTTAARVPTASLLILLAGLVELAQDEPRAAPQLDEVIKLADQAIAAKDYEGYLIKAEALVQKGMWTEGLHQYVEGLRRLIRSDYAEGLHQIVDNHPAFKRPDSLQTPEPVLADQYYASGLVAFYDRRYGAAEKEFFEAVRYNERDARYLYFLGLARLAQGKRDSAYEDFRLASRLEQQGRPGRVAVSSALERVQGTSRQTVNQFRP